jgi:hypothetical protein
MSWSLEVVVQHKETNFQYDKFHGNAKFVFPFKSHVHSSFFVRNSKQAKHKSLN